MSIIPSKEERIAKKERELNEIRETAEYAKEKANELISKATNLLPQGEGYRVDNATRKRDDIQLIIDYVLNSYPSRVIENETSVTSSPIARETYDYIFKQIDARYFNAQGYINIYDSVHHVKRLLDKTATNIEEVTKVGELSTRSYAKVDKHITNEKSIKDYFYLYDEQVIQEYERLQQNLINVTNVLTVKLLLALATLDEYEKQNETLVKKNDNLARRNESQRVRRARLFDINTKLEQEKDELTQNYDNLKQENDTLRRELEELKNTMNAQEKEKAEKENLYETIVERTILLVKAHKKLKQENDILQRELKELRNNVNAPEHVNEDFNASHVQFTKETTPSNDLFFFNSIKIVEDACQKGEYEVFLDPNSSATKMDLIQRALKSYENSEYFNGQVSEKTARTIINEVECFLCWQDNENVPLELPTIKGNETLFAAKYKMYLKTFTMSGDDAPTSKAKGMITLERFSILSRKAFRRYKKCILLHLTQ